VESAAVSGRRLRVPLVVAGVVVLHVAVLVA
jgi:hypothetical protein